MAHFVSSQKKSRIELRSIYLSCTGSDQLFRLGPDLRSEVDGFEPGATAHHGRHLAAGIADKNVGEAVAPDDLCDGLLGGIIAGGVLGSVDGFELVVGVADEVVGEEDGWVRGWGLVIWVGFKCPFI